MTSTKTLPRDLVQVSALVFLFYLVAAFALQAVHVVGSSMSPSLQDNDLVLASRLDYRLHSPERGDIVIVKDPYDPSQDFIKRVIGLPGDRILIRAGHVYIDGDRLDEPYLGSDWRTTINWPAFPERPEGEMVPVGSYFVLGDNRDHSSDSRLFGYIDHAQIEGKALVRFWPPGAAKVLDVHPTIARKP